MKKFVLNEFLPFQNIWDILKMKRGLKVLVFSFIFVMFLVGGVSAGFELGEDPAYDINIFYSPSQNIKGWMNITFEDESVNSVISNDIGDSIKLIDFLNENSAEYNCTPNDCENDYISSNGEIMKEFSLGVGQEKTLSFFISEGNVNIIKELKFDVTISNLPSCINPLKIDILDDGINEWESDKFLSVYSCMYESGTGCFDSSEETTNVLIDDTPLCEKINLIEGGNFSLGAWVKKGNAAWYDGLLKMYLYNSDSLYLASCDLPQPSTIGSEISCTIKHKNPSVQEYYVCIKADDGESTDYEIKKEEVEPCGFYAFPGYETEYHDYYIFAKSARFANIGEFVFNQEEYEKQGNSGYLNDYILNYLDKYNKDCSNGCSIPIKFKSYGNLNVFVLNATLDYSTGAGSQVPKHLIYDTTLNDARIDSNFLKLDLEMANFSVPSEIGDHNINIKLNDELILEQEIHVISVPTIQNIIPNEVPALVPVTFRVLSNEIGNLTYTWDFGDNSTKKISTTNTIEHTYPLLGNYELSVVVKNSFGNSSKTIQVKVGSPNDYVNTTIEDYRNKLDSLESEINKLPAWVGDEINNKLELDALRSDIKTQEDNYKEAFLDEYYVKIMTDLMTLDVPDSFSVSQTFGTSPIFPSEEQINLEALEFAGAGSIDENRENHAVAITNWVRGNLDITLESKTYSLYNNGERNDLYSYLKVILNPKQDLGEVYFLVNGESDEVKFNSYQVKDYNEEDSIIFFSELTESRTIEFLYPGKVDIGNLPIYISPSFSDLDIESEPGVCNFNKRCEKNLGETYKNCRSDCKPLAWVLFWFVVLFFIAFVFYILLQEWYKRYYEAHLFKSKNQLYNLINFINNANNQGIKKSRMFSNLKDLGWNSEQLNYAWNKLHGKRTGMWEIPIFKWVEKRRVKKELAKRKGTSATLKSLGKV